MYSSDCCAIISHSVLDFRRVFYGDNKLNTPPEFRHLHVESVGEVCVVRILTENFHSQAAIDSVSNELLRLAEPGTERNLLLDFSAVTLVSSMMLGRLIHLQKQLAAGNRKLVLCSLQASVFQVFALTRLTKKFDIKTDLTEGLAAF